MKTLENKEINIVFEEGKKVGFFDLAVICLNQVGEQGLPPLQMSERIDLIKKVQSVKVGGKLKLDEKELETLKDCSEKTRWRMIHEDIVKFNKYLEDIK